MKASVEGYEKSPFFFRDRFQDQKRVVVWTSDLRMQKTLFSSFCEILGDRIEYLLKEENPNTSDLDRWARTQGGILLQDLLAQVADHQEWFFKDGSFQFCARKAENPDYFAYDDHGIFWIYSEIPEFVSVLEYSGFEERVDELICDRGHWHVRIKESEREALSFREDLRKRSVF